MGEDTGLKVVTALRRALGVEEEWSIDHPRGFTWWPGPLAQHIWSDPPQGAGDERSWRLHVRSDFIRDFKPEPEQLAKLNIYHAYATMSALLPTFGDTSKLSFGTAVPIAVANLQATVDLLTKVAALQAAEALAHAQDVSNLLEAESNFTVHPSSGPRPDFHDVIYCLARTVEPEGRTKSLFAGAELRRVAEELAELGARCSSDSDGLTAEFPFRDQTGLFRIMCDSPNPWLGNGALVLLDLPIGKGTPPETAMRFNAWEDETVPFLVSCGSWCFSPEHGNLCHVLFLPNSCFAPGLLVKVLDDAINRSEWADLAYKMAFG